MNGNCSPSRNRIAIAKVRKIGISLFFTKSEYDELNIQSTYESVLKTNCVGLLRCVRKKFDQPPLFLAEYITRILFNCYISPLKNINQAVVKQNIATDLV